MGSLLVMQMVDSAFPSGAFAHSGGMEALHQCGGLRDEGDVVLRLNELTWQVALGALPFLDGAHRGAVVEADEAADVFLSNHVARRASQAQGRALMLAAEAMLETDAVRAMRAALPHSHVAVAWGGVLAGHGASLGETREGFVFAAVRGALSAVVRLGVVGPLRAQAVLRGLHPVMREALGHSEGRAMDDAVGVSPWVETAQAAHERLYSRLFQS
jgi:urease accessory protein